VGLNRVGPPDAEAADAAAFAGLLENVVLAK
jgi:hypothetical protein